MFARIQQLLTVPEQAAAVRRTYYESPPVPIYADVERDRQQSERLRSHAPFTDFLLRVLNR
jgi:hypothetical protein